MSKDPAFLFYTSDFLVGVSDLTMEERGQYITLIALQHQKGHLSKKNIQISVGDVSKDVLSKFQIDENGCYYNVRTEEEIIKRENYSKSRYENGCKGGRPKKTIKEPYGFENETICETIAKPKQNHSEDENIIVIDNKDITNIDNKDITNKFNEFWNLYPKKLKKQEAYGAFCKINPNNDLFETIINAIKKCRRWRGWVDKQYIPYPATWLRNKRWEDEIKQEELSSFDAYDEEW